MLICTVRGNIVSTKKDESLVGGKFMVVEPWGWPGKTFVAFDQIGAGVGETVLVALGGAARKSRATQDAAVDAAIVGIVDEGTYDGPS
jgi:ethanolamine utilization protein EutN